MSCLNAESIKQYVWVGIEEAVALTEILDHLDSCEICMKTAMREFKARRFLDEYTAEKHGRAYRFGKFESLHRILERSLGVLIDTPECISIKSRLVRWTERKPSEMLARTIQVEMDDREPSLNPVQNDPECVPGFMGSSPVDIHRENASTMVIREKSRQKMTVTFKNGSILEIRFDMDRDNVPSTVLVSENGEIFVGKPVNLEGPAPYHLHFNDLQEGKYILFFEPVNLENHDRIEPSFVDIVLDDLYDENEYLKCFDAVWPLDVYDDFLQALEEPSRIKLLPILPHGQEKPYTSAKKANLVDEISLGRSFYSDYLSELIELLEHYLFKLDKRKKQNSPKKSLKRKKSKFKKYYLKTDQEYGQIFTLLPSIYGSQVKPPDLKVDDEEQFSKHLIIGVGGTGSNWIDMLKLELFKNETNETNILESYRPGTERGARSRSLLEENTGFVHQNDSRTGSEENRFTLAIAHLQYSLPLGAPVRLQCKLKNISSKDQWIPIDEKGFNGSVSGMVIDPLGKILEWESINDTQENLPLRRIKNGEQISFTTILLYGKDGPLFRNEGYYRIVTEVNWEHGDTKIRVSGDTVIKITGAESPEHLRAVQKIFASPEIFKDIINRNNLIKVKDPVFQHVIKQRVLKPHFDFFRLLYLNECLIQPMIKPGPRLKQMTAILKSRIILSSTETIQLAETLKQAAEEKRIEPNDKQVIELKKAIIKNAEGTDIEYRIRKILDAVA